MTSETSRPAFWIVTTGLSQAGKFFISIIGSVVLARLLAPTDFGLVATISPLVAMADLVRDLGFTQAIIQRRTISGRQVNALFWLSMAITFAIAILLSLISPLVAAFFNEPRLTLLLSNVLVAADRESGSLADSAAQRACPWRYIFSPAYLLGVELVFSASSFAGDAPSRRRHRPAAREHRVKPQPIRLTVPS